MSADVDFALLSPGRSSSGDEADRYVDGLSWFLACAREGCFGVVPFPFDLNEDCRGRDSDAVAAMPNVEMSE